MNEMNSESTSPESKTIETQSGSAATVLPPTTMGPKPKKSPRLAIWLAAILLVVASGIGGYMARGGTVATQKDELATLRAQVTDLQKTMYTLPASAMKVSDCIPNMGFHYVAKGADKEYGPFYLVTKSKKVIGIEYMAAVSMYTKIPDAPGGLEILQKDSPAFGMKFDHIEFSHMPHGHEGLEEDHIDMHMYTVGPDVVKNACN